MHAVVVLGLVPYQAKIGLGKRLRNDLFCEEWDIKPQLNQSSHDECTQYVRDINNVTRPASNNCKQLVIYQ